MSPARAKKTQILNGYGADLARIQHEGYGGLARHAGPAIVGYLRSAGIRRGLVVDLGCGNGILARHLLESGYDVLGVDPSPAILQIARRVASAATFVRRRAEDIELPTCAAVVATGEAITYLGARTAPTLMFDGTSIACHWRLQAVVCSSSMP